MCIEECDKYTCGHSVPLRFVPCEESKANGGIPCTGKLYRQSYHSRYDACSDPCAERLELRYPTGIPTQLGSLPTQLIASQIPRSPVPVSPLSDESDRDFSPLDEKDDSAKRKRTVNDLTPDEIRSQSKKFPRMALDPHQDQDLDPLTTPTRTIGNPSARKPGDMGPPLHRGPGRQPAAGTGRGITSRGDSGPPQFRNPWGPGGNTFGQGVRRSPTPDERSLIPEVDPLTIPPTYMPMSSSGGRTEPSVGEYPGLPRITEPFKSSIFSRMGPGRTDIPSPVEPYKFHEQLSSSAPGPHSVTPKSQRSTRSMDISTILESVVDAEPEAPSGTNRRDGDDRSEPDKKGSLSGEGLALPAPTQGGSSGRNPYDSWAQASPDLSRNRYLPPKVATSPETDASLPLPQTQARAKDASTNTGSRTMVDASMMTEGSTAADPAILEDDLYGASPKAETHSAGKIDTVGDAEVEEGTTQDSSIALETSTADDAAISDDEMYGASPMAEKDARADATIAKDTVTEETIAEDQSPVLKRSVAHELAILEDDTYGPSPREGSNPAVKGAPLRGEGMRDGTATKASPGEHSSTVMDTVNLEDAGDKQQSDGSRDLDSQEHSDPPKRRGKQAKKAVSRKRKR